MEVFSFARPRVVTEDAVINAHKTNLVGVYRLTSTPHTDMRGRFDRLFCAELFAAHGLATSWVQINLSQTFRAGALRGLHWQRPPYSETKLIRCLRGQVYDVAVDIRPGSAQYGQWIAMRLSVGDMIYLPKGVAHGMQALLDDTELLYLMDQPYRREASRGLCWDDPALAIDWPIMPPTALSKQDANQPRLAELQHDESLIC